MQLDETAFPILLADHLRRARCARRACEPWPMVRRAATYLARNGPVTPEDRWEEDGGYSPFTLAVGNRRAARRRRLRRRRRTSPHRRDTCARRPTSGTTSIERWTYVTDTALARDRGVDGYYVRIAPRDVDDGGPPARTGVSRSEPAARQSADAVRRDGQPRRAGARPLRPARGERSANRRIRSASSTALLCAETPTGPTWHRYNDDGYGEHEDGVRVRRNGHRPRLAVARRRARRITSSPPARRTRAASARRHAAADEIRRADCRSRSGTPTTFPSTELFNGCPSGSAMPLVVGARRVREAARGRCETDASSTCRRRP